jgi:putative ABC transport system substrate-binding protein
VQALNKSGWTDGKNIRLEKRFSASNPARLPALANELVQMRCEIIIAEAAQAVDAARNATKTIPIVMTYVGDALGPGYVASLSHPGGNASGHVFQRKEMNIAAPKLGITLQQLPMKTADELDEDLQAAIEGQAQAIVTMEDPMVQSLRARITAFGIRNHLPVVGEFKTMTEAGGLISYGPSQIAMWAHTAEYVDKILRGADPADLPVEQPAKFELVINLKTARAIGFAVPQALLVGADEVIE